MVYCYMEEMLSSHHFLRIWDVTHKCANFPFADVHLLRNSILQMTIVAGEKEHIAFQKAKSGLI